MSEQFQAKLRLKELKPDFLDAPDGVESLIKKYYDKARVPPVRERDNAHLGNLGKLLKFVRNVRSYHGKPDLASLPPGRFGNDVVNIIDSGVHPTSPRAFLEVHRRVDMRSGKAPWKDLSSVGKQCFRTLHNIFVKEGLIQDE